MFIYELTGCGFETGCIYWNIRYRACFEQGVPWQSGNYIVWIHFETYMWHDKIIEATDGVSINVKNTISTNVTNTLPKNVTFIISTASILFHSKKVRSEIDCSYMGRVLLVNTLLLMITIICYHYAKQRSKLKTIVLFQQYKNG